MRAHKKLSVDAQQFLGLNHRDDRMLGFQKIGFLDLKQCFYPLLTAPLRQQIRHYKQLIIPFSGGN